MSGEMPLLLDFARRYPEVWSQLIEMSVANPLGNFLVFQMIATFGALQCSIVTTSRKFLTILFNTIYFGRKVSFVQWLSVGVVFVGVCLDMYGSGKDKAKLKKKAD
jgi:UDP-galactose transporter B1